MKKKILVILIATMTVLSACSYDFGAGNSEGGQKEESGQEQQGQEEGSGQDSGTDESEETDDYTRGTNTDTGWESEFWELRFTAPEGLYMLNDEGLNTAMGLGKELLSKNYTELQAEYAEMVSLYEMMCMSPGGETNVVVTVEKLMMKNMSSADYMKAAMTQLEALKEPVYTILENDGNETEIGGENFCTAKVKGESGGASLYQDYYVRVKNNRAIIIIITYGDGDEEGAQTILNSFEAY